MAKDTDDDKQRDPEGDHSLDMSQAAVKRMIAEARTRGYITYDQLNEVLPPEQVSSEQIEDVMSMLSEMGINIVEAEEAEDDEEEAAKGSTAVVDASKKGGDVATTATRRVRVVARGDGDDSPRPLATARSRTNVARAMRSPPSRPKT